MTIAIENVYIYNNTIYVPIRYIGNKEEHFIKTYNRYLRGFVKHNNKISYYIGFTPYWLDNISGKIYIYHNEFKRLAGTIYFGNDKNLKGIFIFTRKLTELFCIRLFRSNGSFNFKVIFRIK